MYLVSTNSRLELDEVPDQRDNSLNEAKRGRNDAKQGVHFRPEFTSGSYNKKFIEGRCK